MKLDWKRGWLLMPACLLLGLLGCGQAEPAEATSEVSGDMTVVFLKAGAADAAVLMTENATVVIDTGEQDDGGDVVELLQDYGRDKIDLLMISHYDKDHVGGAAEILESVQVSRVIGSTFPKDSDEVADYQAALTAAGLTEETPQDEAIVLDGMVLEVDAPKSLIYSEDQSNNASVMVTVTYGATKLLFTGDAMTRRLAEFSWKNGQYDLIKIPHHGRDAEDLSTYIQAFKSGGAAVITSSKKEPESDALTAALASAGIEVFLTKDGDVTAVSDGQALTVHQ